MATMSRYCKAYYVSMLRQYGAWDAQAANVSKPATETEADGDEQARESQETDEPYLFLHDNYIVTNGIFLDQGVVFDHVTDEWIHFCRETLKFEIPPEVKDNNSVDRA